MVCHGELARTRPASTHLTEFYLWMSVGGVAGGAFNSLLAPVLFTSVLEFPVALILACLLRPNVTGTISDTLNERLRDIALPLMMLGIILGWFVISQRWVSTSLAPIGSVMIACGAAILCFGFQSRPLRFGLGIAAILLVSMLDVRRDATVLHAERSFFGVHRVERTEDGKYHLLVHGNTIHGAQFIDEVRSREPLVYYHRHSPIGGLLDGELAEAWRRIGVVGLGIGTLASYSRSDQNWTYFEIDPTVKRLAQDSRFFTYLRDSAAPVRIVLGDARLTIADARPGEFDLLVLDAFSSDAIPAHLLTREAVQLYLRKLSDRGLLVFHISNRHLDLAPVLAKLADDARLTAYVGSYEPSNDDADLYPSASKWVAMSRHADTLQTLADDTLWTRLRSDPTMPVWTDDYSNLLQVLKWFH
jgi:hypothetical protein